MIYILLPAYNEEKALPKLFDTIKNSSLSKIDTYKIIVVDDGSTDDTAKITEEYKKDMPVILIKHEINKNLGVAMKTGFFYLKETVYPEDYIVTLDADNTHNPELISEMIDKAKKGYDLVIASRYAPGGKELGLSPHRKILSRGAGILLRIFFPDKGARDYTCGFRLYRGSIVKKAIDYYGDDFIQEQGFVCMAEILVKLIRIKAEISEVGLVLRYDLKEGASKLKVFKTILGYFRLIFNNRDVILKSRGF